MPQRSSRVLMDDSTCHVDYNCMNLKCHSLRLKSKINKAKVHIKRVYKRPTYASTNVLILLSKNVKLS
jgi:hypothetical protein